MGVTKSSLQITAAIDNKQYNNMQEGEQYHSNMTRQQFSTYINSYYITWSLQQQ